MCHGRGRERGQAGARAGKRRAGWMEAGREAPGSVASARAPALRCPGASWSHTPTHRPSRAARPVGRLEVPEGAPGTGLRWLDSGHLSLGRRPEKRVLALVEYFVLF